MPNASGTAHLYHLDGEIDPHLDRHSRALRRGVRWIVASAVVGALLFGLFSLGKDYGGSTSLQLPSSAAELDAVNIPIESMTGDITGPSMKAALEADDLEADIESQVGGKINVTVTDSSTSTGVHTTISVASDEGRTTRAVELYGTSYQGLVQSAIKGNIDQLTTVITGKEQSATDQIEALDEQLRQPGLTDAFADSLSSQRLSLESELRSLTAEGDALTQFASRPIGVVAPSDVQAVGGGAVPFIAGALLGTILATVGVLARSFFNTRVTGRDAVDASIAGQIIAVTALDTPDHLDTLARSDRESERGTTCRLRSVRHRRSDRCGTNTQPRHSTSEAFPRRPWSSRPSSAWWTWATATATGTATAHTFSWLPSTRRARRTSHLPRRPSETPDSRRSGPC